jgi:hypothetical protein
MAISDVPQVLLSAIANLFVSAFENARCRKRHKQSHVREYYLDSLVKLGAGLGEAVR